MTVSLAVSTQYAKVTDTHPATARRHKPRLRYV